MLSLTSAPSSIEICNYSLIQTITCLYHNPSLHFKAFCWGNPVSTDPVCRRWNSGLSYNRLNPGHWRFTLMSNCPFFFWPVSRFRMKLIRLCLVESPRKLNHKNPSFKRNDISPRHCSSLGLGFILSGWGFNVNRFMNTKWVLLTQLLAELHSWKKALWSNTDPAFCLSL